MADGKVRLDNPKWEHFAQLVSGGTSATLAYEQAGFAPDRKNALKLAKKPEIVARIDALLQPVMQRFEITRERWAQEVSALAFSDIGEIIEWQTDTVQDVDNDDGGDVMVIRHIHTHKGTYRPSRELSPHVRAAIQSIKITADGDIEAKMHPKLGALRLLGESLRLLGRNQRADEDPGQVPAGERSASELRALFERSLKEHEDRSVHARLIEGSATEQPG
jgi:hypothetical protein